MPLNLPFAVPERLLLAQRGGPTGVTYELAPSTISGAATVTATLIRNRAVTATSVGSATVTAGVVRIRARTAAAAGAATVSAAIVRGEARTAAVSGTSTVACSLTRTRTLTATPQGTATVAAGIVGFKTFTATSTGTATVSGSDLIPQTAAVQTGGMLIPIIRDHQHEPLETHIIFEGSMVGAATVRADLNVVPFAENTEAMLTDLESLLELQLV